MCILSGSWDVQLILSKWIQENQRWRMNRDNQTILNSKLHFYKALQIPFPPFIFQMEKIDHASNIVHFLKNSANKYANEQ